MKPTTLYTAADRDRLRRFISAQEARLSREREALAFLSARVEGAHAVEAQEAPADLVTMYSQIRMRDADSGRAYVMTVALPSELESHSEPILGRASPVVALLGSRVGDEVCWRLGGRLHGARIEEMLFQPESAARRSVASRKPIERWLPASASFSREAQVHSRSGRLPIPGAAVR